MMTMRNFMILGMMAVLIGTGLRLADLKIKPVHHDESVNYAFTKKLADSFFYKYNPNAYHGPFLYFATLPAYYLLGPSKFSLRLTTASFGVLAILLMLMMHRSLGKRGALIGAILLALSPADVYFSRTFIHENFLAAFATGTLSAFLSLARRPRTVNLFALVIFLAICFTIKETTVLFVVALVGAYATTRLYFWGIEETTDQEDRLKIDGAFVWKRKLFLADALAIGITIWMLLYTSFLTYPHGLFRFFEAFMPWLNTGLKDSGHCKPFSYFFILVGKYYAPLVIPALLTGLWSLGKKKPRGVFLFFLSMFQLILYSAIPYKTPWCLLQIGIPIIALAGYGLSKALDPARSSRLIRSHVWGLLLITVVPWVYFSFMVNYVAYDDNDIAIVYVQTDRSYEDMFRLLERIGRRSGEEKNLEIAMIKAKNPGRLYLRDYANVTKLEDVPDQQITQPIVLVNSTLADSALEKMAGEYITLKYPVWPGTYVTLFVEESFYERYAKEET